MKHLVTSIVLLLSISAIAFGQTPNDRRRAARVEAELRNLVRQWDDADVRGDVATLDRLLAAEFAFVGGQTKAQYLEETKKRPNDFTIDSAVSRDVEVRVYGNTAVLTGLDTISGKNKGKPYVNRWLYMDVWIKRDGRWQCVKTYSTLAK